MSEEVKKEDELFELFELCKKVSEKTGWDNNRPFYPKWEWQVGGTIPFLYDSDYLLERLPKAIDLKKTYMDRFGSQELEWFYEAICYGFDSNNLIEHADTPLKALLKLTIALSDAGEL